MRTAFISGHLDLTQDEFDREYIPLIEKALLQGDKFVIGDARGADTIAQKYLSQFNGWTNVTIYHMFESPRNNVGNYKTVGGFKNDSERDCNLTYCSDYDIAWVRPGRENSGTAKNLRSGSNRKDLYD